MSKMNAEKKLVRMKSLRYRMLVFAAVALAAVVLYLPSPALATTLVWTLVDVRFQDGSGATGSFILDTTRGITDWNITTEATASPDFPDFPTFTYTSVGCQPDDCSASDTTFGLFFKAGNCLVECHTLLLTPTDILELQAPGAVVDLDPMSGEQFGNPGHSVSRALDSGALEAGI